MYNMITEFGNLVLCYGAGVAKCRFDGRQFIVSIDIVSETFMG